MRVLKFGGSSVADQDRIQNVIKIVTSTGGSTPTVVVVSALGGITDQLISCGQQAAAGSESYRAAADKVEHRHRELLAGLASGRHQSEANGTLDKLCQNLRDILHGIFLIRELTPRCLDYISSFGELASAAIVSAAFLERGHKAHYVDARKLLVTDEHFGHGNVDKAVSYAKIEQYFKGAQGIHIVTGFIAATPAGETTTLGRGGSDYTAALIAAALAAPEVEIWTDVSGLMTADPRKVKKAFSQPAVSYEEAMELSHFGAKVVFPPTIQPAIEREIPIRIKNTFDAENAGTIISASAAEQRSAVTGISSIPEIALLRLQGSGMVGVPGTSMRLYQALAEAAINVILVTQASSEHTICLAVVPKDAPIAKRAVDAEFALEMQAGILDPMVSESGLGIVSVIGDNMRNSPGIAGKIFGALGKNGVNVVAIAQGSSERNISFVLSSADEGKALNALHDEFFFPDTKQLNLYQVGVGLIGAELLRQLEQHAAMLRAEHGHDVRIIGLANSKQVIVDPEGLNLSTCKKMLDESTQAGNAGELVQKMRALNLPNSVFVDCTASEQVTKLYRDVLLSGASLITPNKKAQSGPYEAYAELKRLTAKRPQRFLYETSVGAGLPVISTLNDLLKSGDEVLRIEAVLSGTLSFIFNSLEKGRSFSEIVKKAQEAGYTEPDPRDDLNGLDVARKLLILAREIGWRVELAEVQVENLVPENCRGASSVAEFFELLSEWDAEFEKKRAHAADGGCKLCYIASLENQKATVALREISSTHPFFNLSGSDNIVSFTTRRYRERPLVVKGPGAGAEVTAAGVFADILRVA